MESIQEEEENIEYDFEDEGDNEIDDFLADLGSDRFVSKPEVSVKQQKQEATEMKKIVAEQAREHKRQIAEQKRQDAQTKKQSKSKKSSGDDDEMFSGDGTPILGKDKIMLMKKVQQYKSLFPDELKGFKVKKNPSPQDLTEALEEMSVLVEVGSMDEFMMSSVLSCIKLVEGASSVTSYDIRGCADMLKNNKEFNKLCKVLFIKYNVFSKVPPEFQMILLVSTTAYMCSQKNKNKGAINDYLNTTI